MSNTYDIFVWSSDFSQHRGEGLLARKFVDIFFKSSKIKIKVESNEAEYFFYKKKYEALYNKSNTSNFYYKYITMYKGILSLWKNYFLKKKLCYINYLPIWNPFIFFFLPPGTIIGPITGSIYKGKVINLNLFLRKYILSILSKISLCIIFKRFKFVIFSTDNLKDSINKNKYKKCLFNFVYLFYKMRKKKYKDIDFLIYYRQHSMKSNTFVLSLCKKLVGAGKKVIIVGDYFFYPGIKNYQNLPRAKVLRLLDRSNYTIASDENFFSLFVLDSLSCGVKIFFNNKKYNKVIFFKSLFLGLDYDNLPSSCKTILTKKKYIKNYSLVDAKFDNQQKKILSQVNKLRYCDQNIFL